MVAFSARCLSRLTFGPRDVVHLRRAARQRVTAASLRLRLPPVLAEQWDESHGEDIFANDRSLLPRQHREGLHILTAKRNQQAAAFRELIDERLRDGRRAGT